MTISKDQNSEQEMEFSLQSL